MADNQNNTPKSNSEPKYIIETLKAKDENKILHYVYPITLIDAVIDRNGVSLEEKLTIILEKLQALESIISTGSFSGLPYSVTFDSVNNLSIDGTWNEDEKRIEF